jgi:hypothetical protein
MLGSSREFRESQDFFLAEGWAKYIHLERFPAYAPQLIILMKVSGNISNMLSYVTFVAPISIISVLNSTW